jgi:hypothetical protein
MYNKRSKSGYRQPKEASKVLQCEPNLEAIKKAITDKWGANAKALWLCSNRVDARESIMADYDETCLSFLDSVNS